MPALGIATFCAIAATIHFATFGQASLLNQAVFPDDEKIPTFFARGDVDNSEEESNISTENHEVCRTDGCRTIAEEFLSSINKSVDPCNNFYDYVCGGWTTENAIPPSLPSWSRFMMFQKVVHYRIKGVLETVIEPSDILPVKQAKKWYRSCMDTETLQERKLKPIESVLIETGGWPITMDEEEWDGNEHAWQKVADDYTRLTGSHVFYQIEAMGPHTEADHGIITIRPQELPLSEHMPLKYRNYSGNDYEYYLHFVSEVARIFIEDSRANVSEEKRLSDAKEIVEFEKSVYELKKDRHFGKMTLQEFDEWYNKSMAESGVQAQGKFDWQPWIQKQFDTVNLRVHPSTDLRFDSLKHIKGMSELLEKTPMRIIVNYIHWHFVANMLAYTTEDARIILYRLLMEEYGIRERPPRWSECVDEMKMVHASAYAFVNKYFLEHTVKEVSKMTEAIRKAMNEQIEASTWLDEESKVLSKDKLNSMKIFIGFPDWYKNKTFVTKFYKGLTIGNEYFGNTLSYMKYERKMALKRYTIPPGVDEDSWFLDPITVNALYGPDDNTLNIPAADFQAPLFTPGVPDNVNYGVAGVVVGHEIGHGFDDLSIMYGKDGNKTKLSKSMLMNFYQRAECFLDQFDEYYGETKPPELFGTTIDPEMMLFVQRFLDRRKSRFTRGENMADSTGIQAVFEAYKKLAKPSVGVRLEGMEDFTDDQLFFVSFAAMWCEIGTPQYMKKKAEEKNVHSPPKYRVLGGVSNSKGFAEAFNCPVGSPMNPADKCSVWGKEEEKVDMELAWMKGRPNRWGGQWRW
ncbi:neprilysin-11-like [Venturia canescens]|uniref:neprilysin-11-like n=1 Tax=Venturia canescens TaxID=32260 RepID=UPI001C9D2CB1|nr:neprilysin-11-like [Venturia canescens]